MRTATYEETCLTELRRSGGFTFDPVFVTEPDDGWAVGMEGYEAHIPLESITPNHITAHAATLPKGTYQGGWVQDWVVYLDAVIIESNRDRALALARLNHQQAIYNLRTGEVVDLSEPVRTHEEVSLVAGAVA